MRKGLTFLPSLALTVLLALPVQAETASGADTVVASVNGVDITLGHMILAHATLPEQYQALPADVLFEGILDQLIQQSMLAQSHGPDVSNAIELALENERRSLLAASVLDQVLQSAASETEIQQVYDADYSNAKGGSEYNASHILVDTKEEADAIVAALQEGADFAETAKEKSTGPSGPGGGSLGWFGTGRMVPEFETAVVALTPGEISDPVQTQFGWHVIKLNQTRQLDAPTLDQVRAEIADTLRNAAVETHLEALREATKIDRPQIEGLDPEILRDVELLEN